MYRKNIRYVLRAFFMSLIMSFIISGAILLIHNEFIEGFLKIWMLSFLTAFLIAFPVALTITPIVTKIALKICKDL